MLPDEQARGLGSKCISAMLENNMVRIFHEKTQGYKGFRFDKVFNEESTQSQVFNESEI